MITEYVSMTEEEPDGAAIARAGDILKRGGLVAFPTETVYGLGGDALNPESARKIYAAKGRPSDNPLIVHICRPEAAERIAERIPEAYHILAERFWPGPLTMILPKSRLVPPETTGGLDTVAIRFPRNRIALALIEAGGGYVAAPSANRSGRPSPTLARYCREDLDGLVDMIIDGGQVDIGVESSIIDLSGETPTILRPGFVTKEMLEDALGSVALDRTILGGSSGERPRAPGMKYRHYAPRGELSIVEGAAAEVIRYINERTAEAAGHGLRTGVICTDETRDRYRADSVKSAGTRTEERMVARELFRILREFDDEGVQLIFSEAFADDGIGMAVMNRLMKAAGHRVIDLT
ncbi:L-threonylcarbamoyladenylate synthase [Lachnoclostridium sp. Marseille-P6806]|uniref:L-threonylcarbamoyladenylate synthase n=1 Tax=Lachnoclostridium sp. Marseille-P6806 TaxID=2364793 RepID=UPI001031A84B|nr:L-threonylcarbamoyladenylate synthase [Lachnoclostridium sp. Marseille-P6806]